MREGHKTKSYMFCFLFFFSSRRRHTRCGRDWSSDVCSSDLVNLQDPSTYTASPFAAVRAATLAQTSVPWLEALGERHNNVGKDASSQNVAMKRSEERRVGKECRSRWSP